MDLSRGHESSDDEEECITFNIKSTDNPLRIIIPPNPKSGFNNYSKKSIKLSIESFFYAEPCQLGGRSSKTTLESDNRAFYKGIAVHCKGLTVSNLYDENGKPTSLIEFFPAKMNNTKILGAVFDSLSKGRIHSQSDFGFVEFGEKVGNKSDGIELGSSASNWIDLEFILHDTVYPKYDIWWSGPTIDDWNVSIVSDKDMKHREALIDFKGTTNPLTNSIYVVEPNLGANIVLPYTTKENPYYIRVKLTFY